MLVPRLPSLVLVFLALGSAVALLIWHIRGVRRSEAEPLETAELAFRRRQFRRRVQVSAMLGLLGLSLIAAPLISHRDRPLVFLVYWTGAVAWLGWIVLLALGDAWSSQQHIRRQSRFELDRIRRDREQIARIHLAEQNGHDREAT